MLAIKSIRIHAKLLALGMLLYSLLFLISWQPQHLYSVYNANSYLILHAILEFASVVVSFCVFAVVWYSFEHTRNSRDLFLASTIFAVSLLDIAHIFTYTGMPDLFIAPNINQASLYWVAARLISAVTLLITAFMPRRFPELLAQRHWLVTFPLLITLGVLVHISLYPNRFPLLHDAFGQTGTKLRLEYSIMTLNAVAIISYGRRSPWLPSVHFLRIALVFCLFSELAFTFNTHVYDIYNLVGHLYKFGAYYYLFRALFETSILRPYICISRMARTLRKLAHRSSALYKDAKKSKQLWQQTFVDLSAALAAKHDLKEMLDKILDATTKFFGIHHACLALAEGQPPQLRIVAARSKIPLPSQLTLSESFHGRVFLERKPMIIDDITQHSDPIYDHYRHAGLRSSVAVPIMHNDEAIGVLELVSPHEKSFTPHDAALLSVFAQHAGEAITNAKLFEATVNSLKEITLLYDIVKDLSGTASPAQLLKNVTAKTDRYLEPDGIAAYIMHHRSDGLHAEPVIAHNLTKEEVTNLQTLFSSSKAWWPWADLVNANSCGQGQLITMSVLTKRRLDIVPLLTGDGLQGIIVFVWNNPDQGIPDDFKLTLETIACQTAIGLERAFLYETSRVLSLTDALTLLPNRRQFDLSLNKELTRAILYNRPISLLMIDIDFFKKINDTYGHLAGDAILQQLADLLRTAFATTEIPARFGGEEFAVILPETGPAEAAKKADDFRQYVAQKRFSAGHETVQLTISVGVAGLESNVKAEITGNDLIAMADKALYKAKQSGRNKVVMWENTFEK